MDAHAEKCIAWLGLHQSFSEHLLRGLEKVEISADWFDEDWEQVLLKLVPGWHQKGTGLQALNWSEKQVFAYDEIKKVPGWSGKILHPKTYNL